MSEHALAPPERVEAIQLNDHTVQLRVTTYCRTCGAPFSAQRRLTAKSLLDTLAVRGHVDKLAEELAELGKGKCHG